MQTIASAPSRVEQVYQAIRDSICDCSLEAGTHLVQEDLAATLGVSRQPIQQAMLLLKNDGLVVERGARGLYVAPLDTKTVEHHYQVRMVLDELAARLVANNAVRSIEFADELRRLGEGLLEEGRRAQASGSAVEAVRHDVEFHRMIYRQSGNPLIESTAEVHWHRLRRLMISVLLHADRGPLVWQQHGEILDALVAGDADLATQLVITHIVGAQEALVDALAMRESGRVAAE